jgi:acyl-CoA synthetase (NDP forming)
MSDESFADVSGLLNPRSIAVVGASDRPGNLGGDTVRRLIKFKFTGPVWPVNRTADAVAKLKCYPSVGDLPGVPDLAIFAIPADGLLQAIGECIEVGTRNGIVYAGGLGEAGSEGALLQQAIVDLCRRHDFKLCGPNCVGIINCAAPATATFATALHELETLRPGMISMVSQSGGLGTSFFAMIYRAGFGFRHLVSSGNEAVVSFADYLYAMARDEGTGVIAAYLEGVTDGPKLVRALAEARRQRKPVVIVKSGAGKTSAKAAQAHTGALVGEDRVFDAILQEMGAIRVYSIEELADVCLMLVGMGKGRLPAGPGVGIVTFGGGNGVLGVDQCEQAGLTVPPLQPEGVERLRSLLVSTATASNPVDLTPSTAFRPESLAQLPAALDVMIAEPDIDVLMMIASSLPTKAVEISAIVADLWDRSPKPVCMSWPDTPTGTAARLAARGVPVFAEPARAARALGGLVRHRAALDRPLRPDVMTPRPFDWARHVSTSAPQVISENQCHAVMKAAGLPVAAGELVQDEAGALRAADALGLPVALKGISPRVTHRAAAGLLAIDLRSREEVADAYRRLNRRAQEIGVSLDGIYVQKMHKGGVELLASAFRDPIFGPVISCGSGGGLTELIDDVAIERAPVSREIAAAMIGRLRIRRHARDEQGPLPTTPAADFLVRLSELAASAPWSTFVLEVNPIKWTRESAIAVDGLLIVEKP